jgi:maleate isomerase
MSEWRGKAGWIVPSWNTVIEFDVARSMPGVFSNHFGRISHQEDSEAAFDQMAAEAPHALDLLMHAEMDVVCYACTAGSFVHGFEADRQFRDELSARSGRPVLSMASTLVDAARALGVSTVSVAAPYEEWLVDRLAGYLESAGIRVSGTAWLGQQANVAHGPHTAYELAVKAHRDDAEAVIVSCGNFRTLEVIEQTERELGVPVISSNQAAIWAVARTLEPGNQFAGTGRLWDVPVAR